MRTDWEERWPKEKWGGLRVEVTSADQKKLLGPGTIRELVPLDVEFEEGSTERLTDSMPRIELDSGEELLGCECWWIPLELAEELKAEKGA